MIVGECQIEKMNIYINDIVYRSRETKNMGSFGDRVDKIMEEFHQPMELKAVVDFLQEKKKLLSIDTNDIEKFQEIPGPNFFNLTKKEISHKSGQFNLKYAQADNILNVVDALNLIREAENKLKKVEMSVESAVKLIKNLESEQTISGEKRLAMLFDSLR